MDAARLRVLEQQAEALVAQAVALMQAVTALVSEAEHKAIEKRAGPAPVPDEKPGPAFYGGFGEPAQTTETRNNALARPKRARRSP